MTFEEALNKIDVRQAVYHYLMMGEGVDWILSKIDPDDLSELGKNIYRTAEGIRSEGSEVDIVIMKSRTGIEGKVLSKLLKQPDINYKSAVNAFKFENSEIHARNVIKSWLDDGDIFQNMDQVLNKVEAYRQKSGYETEEIKTIQDGLSEAKEYTERLIDGKVNRINTGLIDLDNMLGDIEEGEFVIIGARPSVGKTALSLQVAKFISNSLPVGFFSLEMTVRGLAYRQIHEITGKSKDDLKTDKGVLRDAVNQSYRELKDKNLFVNENNLSYITLRNKFEKMIKKGCKVIFIDYLQLINHSFKSQNDGYTEISKRLKQLAKEFRVPVIALSQLNRKSTDRKHGEPFVSDLRESGQIEQDADKILLLWKPPLESLEGGLAENYEVFARDDKLLAVKIGKNRDGRVGQVNLCFDKQLMRISCIDAVHVDLR